MELICQTKNSLQCDLSEFFLAGDLNESKEQHFVDCIDVAWMLFFVFNPQISAFEQLPLDPEVLISKRKCNEIFAACVGSDLWMDSSGV